MHMPIQTTGSAFGEEGGKATQVVVDVYLARVTLHFQSIN